MVRTKTLEGSLEPMPEKSMFVDMEDIESFPVETIAIVYSDGCVVIQVVQKKTLRRSAWAFVDGKDGR